MHRLDKETVIVQSTSKPKKTARSAADAAALLEVRLFLGSCVDVTLLL